MPTLEEVPKKSERKPAESITRDVERENRQNAKIPKPRNPRSALVVFSFVWIAVIVFLAVFAGFLPLSGYQVPVGPPRELPQLGSLDMLLGTDSLGRSMLSRCIYGAQVSLIVGVVAGFSGFLIGTVLGSIAGYLGGRLDSIISLLSDAMLAFPPLILLLTLSSIYTPSIGTLLVGLTFVVVPTFTRLARANTMGWASRDFVLAAKNIGTGSAKILVKEIFPNVLPSLVTYMPIVVASLIVAEGSLSFLGLGVPPPTPSWGGMIADGKDSLQYAPQIVFIPASIIFLTVFALNQSGDYLRARFDPAFRS
jgi:peptide/nickel transport system permease protein